MHVWIVNLTEITEFYDKHPFKVPSNLYTWHQYILSFDISMESVQFRAV